MVCHVDDLVGSNATWPFCEAVGSLDEKT